ATISGDGTLAILGGTSTIDSNVTVGLFRLVGGTLSGTGNLTPTSFSLEGGVLDRDLTLTTGTSSIQNVNVSAGHTLTNGVNSILTAPAGPGERQAFGLGTFNNEGTFIKNGTARSYMSVTHANNVGDVQVQQSALRFDQIGQHTGTFEISSGAQLEFAGTQSLSSTATISGDGTLAILGGTSTIDSNVTVGLLRLVGGTLSGTGNLTATSYSLEAGVLNRDLTLSSGTSSIQNVNVSAGHTLTNGVNSILTAPAGPGERQAFGLGTFNNEGTFIKTGSARSYMSITHANNLGDVQVQQSQLRFDQTGEHTGTFEVSAGAQIEFGGTQLLNSTATVSGAGTMVIVGGNVTIDSDVTLSSLRVIGGVMKGDGIINAPTSVENLLSGISAGDGVGTLTLNSGLTLQSGTILFWDLGALDTDHPGVDWDQIVINGGQLNLGSFNFMKIGLPGNEFSPISGNPFWGTSHRWDDIVNLTGGATGIVGVPNFTVDNTSWSRAGSFAVELSSDGRGLDVVWTAVPESSTFLLAGLVVIGFIIYLKGSGSFNMIE
ncbi:hypothetical protein K2Y11_08760, partial [bacterium]|nr:hypothetical protein [bacterium]